MNTRLIETEKGPVEYTMYGTGTVVLAIVGGHTNCRETIFRKGWDTSRYCFLTPSRPGYGLTPLTERNKTAKGTAELFAALLDELGIGSAIVLGISAGGLTALEFAGNFQRKVIKLVLMSALTKKWFATSDMIYLSGKIVFAPWFEKITWAVYRQFFRLFPNAMTRLMFKQLSTFRPIEYSHDESLEMKQMTLIMRSYRGFTNDLDQSISNDALLRVDAPTLIIHSVFDNAVDFSHAINARDHIRNSKLIATKNRWAHLIWIGDDYYLILAEMLNWIE